MADHCPRDGSELVEVERSGVTIDACPTCRGVWLDRGELENDQRYDHYKKRRRKSFLEELFD